MALRMAVAALIVFLASCTLTQNVPISLQIIQPHDGDTLHVDSIPIEGTATVGATVHVAGTLSDTGMLFPLDSKGHFIGKIGFEDLNGTYAAVFKVTKPGADPITESRTVYYVRVP